jgi:flagellin
MSNAVVNTNIEALNTHRNLKGVGVSTAKAAERLSGGLRINSAADDAAGLAISEKMRSQIRGLQQAERNVEDGINLIKTADGGMSEITGMINRQRELVIQGMNDTNTSGDRKNIQKELDQLNYEIASMAERTEFNTIPLLNQPEKDGEIEITIPGYYRQDPPYLISADYYEVYKLNSQLSSDSIKTKITGATFSKFSYTTDFSYYDGTKQYNFDFNIETYLANNDNVKDPPANYRELSFGEFVKSSLYDSGNTPALYSEKAAYFTQRVAQALTDGFRAKTGDTSVTVIGEYEDTDTIRLYINSNGSGRGFLSDACHSHNGESVENAFGHLFIHMAFGVDASTRIADANKWVTPDPVWVEPSKQTVFETASKPIWIQSGANEHQGVFINRYDCRPAALGIDTIVTEPFDEAEKSLKKLDDALDALNAKRANAGAQQNRLEQTGKSVAISAVNLQDSESRIRDADMAKEMMNLTTANVLNQAGIAMLTQNARGPERVLALLRQ